MKIAVHYVGDLCKLNENFNHHFMTFELHKHDVDYYIHTWESPDNQLQINNFDKPKISSITSPKLDPNSTPYAQFINKSYLIMLAMSDHVVDAKYDAVLILQSDLIIEHKLSIDKCNLKLVNTLNPTFFENPLIENVYFNNMFILSNAENMLKYGQMYPYLVENLQNKPVDEVYYNYLSSIAQIQYKINLESYIRRDPAEVVPSNDSKTCLIVAFYFGKRDKNVTIHSLTDIQKRFLKKYKHNLARIVFAIAEDNRKTVTIEEKDGITYFYKPNRGLSFGSWHTVVSHYKDMYSHYIFGEDDYVFVKDNFDQILLDQYKKKQTSTEYLVTWKSIRSGFISTIGIVSSTVLAKYNYLNNIKWTTNKGQSMKIFLDTFANIKPLAKEYSAFPYWGLHGQKWDVWLFDYICGESSADYLNRTLVAAVQFIDKKDNLKVPQISNALVVNDKLELVIYS